MIDDDEDEDFLLDQMLGITDIDDLFDDQERLESKKEMEDIVMRMLKENAEVKQNGSE